MNNINCKSFNCPYFFYLFHKEFVNFKYDKEKFIFYYNYHN